MTHRRLKRAASQIDESHKSRRTQRGGGVARSDSEGMEVKDVDAANRREK